MPGITPTDWLDVISWGTSTGGAAGSAETTSTLGTDRTDYRVPPSTYHIGGLQLARMRQLLVSMSEYFKGGTRLRVLTQTSNPFSGSESGLYLSTSGVFYPVYNGTQSLGITSEYIEMTEMTAPAAPAANKGRLYMEDNGAGKTRLVVRFPSGAAQVIATEP